MPIYEFYCADCHTVFNFFSSRVDTETRPACPSCQRHGLERKPSRFATLEHTRQGDAGEPSPLDSLEDPRMEAAMQQLMHEMEGQGGGDIGDGTTPEDPRQMGHFLRRFSELSGLQLSDRMQDMMQRLERGDDPDTLEAELGDPPEDDADALGELFQLKKQALAHRRKTPKVDETLYFL